VFLTLIYHPAIRPSRPGRPRHDTMNPDQPGSGPEEPDRAGPRDPAAHRACGRCAGPGGRKDCWSSATTSHRRHRQACGPRPSPPWPSCATSAPRSALTPR